MAGPWPRGGSWRMHARADPLGDDAASGPSSSCRRTGSARRGPRRGSRSSCARCSPPRPCVSIPTVRESGPGSTRFTRDDDVLDTERSSGAMPARASSRGAPARDTPCRQADRGTRCLTRRPAAGAPTRPRPPAVGWRAPSWDCARPAAPRARSFDDLGRLGMAEESMHPVGVVAELGSLHLEQHVPRRTVAQRDEHAPLFFEVVEDSGARADSDRRPPRGDRRKGWGRISGRRAPAPPPRHRGGPTSITSPSRRRALAAAEGLSRSPPRWRPS